MKKLLNVRVIFLGILFILVGATVYGGISFYRQKTKPYNVLMISVDTLRPDQMSLYGNPQKTTPSIDQWAKKDGIVFTQAYTPVPITYPSFASIMTGLSPYQSSIYTHGKITAQADGTLTVETTAGNSPTASDTPTLAEILKKKRYNTGAFLINANLRARTTNLQRGFDQYNVAGDNYALYKSSAWL